MNCQRHLFDIPEDIAFFNFAGLAPILKSSRDVGLSSVQRKARAWLVGEKERIEEPDRLRSLFANLIGATAGDVALIPAASYGIATAAMNLDLKKGQKIVVLADQYPNNVLPWIKKSENVGAEVVFVKRPEDDDLTKAVLSAIDERTAITALPHCFWIDGTRLDLSQIGQRCREIGSALVIDATQSLGAVPFDVTKVQPDFLICSAYKWLLCPYTLGFLYVAPQHQDGVPLVHSWRGEVRSGWGADWKDGHMVYSTIWQPGTARFNMGETGNIISIPMAIDALEQIELWGVSEINTSLRRITQTIIDRTSDLGLVAPSEKYRGGHMVGLRLADRGMGDRTKDLQSRFADQKIYLSVRGDVIRIAPHLSVNETDIDRLISSLASFL